MTPGLDLPDPDQEDWDVPLNAALTHVHNDAAAAQSTADGAAPSAHTHDDRYYTETEADSKRPQVQVAVLDNDTAASLSTPEQWGLQNVTFSDPGFAVTVTAHFTGRLQGAVGSNRTGGSRVDISFDNGSTYQDGEMVLINAHGDARNVTLANGAFRTGTPTSTIRVRVMLEQRQGVAGDSNFVGGVVTVYLIPT